MKKFGSSWKWRILFYWQKHRLAYRATIYFPSALSQDLVMPGEPRILLFCFTEFRTPAPVFVCFKIPSAYFFQINGLTPCLRWMSTTTSKLNHIISSLKSANSPKSVWASNRTVFRTKGSADIDDSLDVQLRLLWKITLNTCLLRCI